MVTAGGVNSLQIKSDVVIAQLLGKSAIRWSKKPGSFRAKNPYTFLNRSEISSFKKNTIVWVTPHILFNRPPIFFFQNLKMYDPSAQYIWDPPFEENASP